MRLVVSYKKKEYEWSVEFSSSEDVDKVYGGIRLELWESVRSFAASEYLREKYLRKVPRPICAVPQWARNEYLAELNAITTIVVAVPPQIESEGGWNDQSVASMHTRETAVGGCGEMAVHVHEQCGVGATRCNLATTQACKSPVGWNSESAKVWDPGKQVQTLPE